MTQHKPVLTDDDINDFFRQFRHIRFTCLDTMNYALAKGIEQSVLAKLAEQEPVVYRFLPPGTQQYMYITDDVPKIKEFEPLYAHPPMLTDHIPDAGQMINLSLSVDTKETQTLLQSYLDNLKDWQLVPIELTNEMRGKFWEADEKYQDGLATMPDAGYKAMLAASPKYEGKINGTD